MRRPPRDQGQASVELIAVLPALLLATLVAVQLAVAGYSVWSAGSAARAGARAAAVGGDVTAAARQALPRPLRAGARVERHDGVEVTVRAPALVPGLAAVPISARANLDPTGGGDG